MASSTVLLPSGKSKVWQYFGFKTDEKGTILNKKEVLCQKCEQRLPYSGNTTNLTHHLKYCHEEEYVPFVRHRHLCLHQSQRKGTNTNILLYKGPLHSTKPMIQDM